MKYRFKSGRGGRDRDNNRKTKRRYAHIFQAAGLLSLLSTNWKKLKARRKRPKIDPTSISLLACILQVVGVSRDVIKHGARRPPVLVGKCFIHSFLRVVSSRHSVTPRGAHKYETTETNKQNSEIDSLKKHTSTHRINKKHEQISFVLQIHTVHNIIYYFDPYRVRFPLRYHDLKRKDRGKRWIRNDSTITKGIGSQPPLFRQTHHYRQEI